MKIYILPVFLFCFFFVLPFYFPSLPWLLQSGEVEKSSKLKSCSPNHIFCVDFKVITRGATSDSSYYSGYFVFKNKKTGELAEINNFFIDFEDISLRPSEFMWKDNSHLDVYLQGKKEGKTSNFFFKNLGNLSVIIHRSY